MPQHETVALSGVIINVFAHRFTLSADGIVHLADLGPKGAEIFHLREGLPVDLQGEMRPSEIKVTQIAECGKRPIALEHKKPHHGAGHHEPHHPDADPAIALATARATGWTPHGEPARKPAHFEVLARRADGPWTELHIDLEGNLYKSKVLPGDGGKWAARIGTA